MNTEVDEIMAQLIKQQEDPDAPPRFVYTTNWKGWYRFGRYNLTPLVKDGSIKNVTLGGASADESD